MAEKVLAVLALAFLLSMPAAAWGNETQKNICDTVVAGVWGQQAVKNCLTFDKNLQKQLCSDLRETIGEDAYMKCVEETEKGVYLHPATIPYALFNDPQEHYDYSICLAKGPANEQLMCGDPMFTPAKDNSQKWFTKAVNAGNLCTRIAFFCIGSNYYSDSRFKLNNVQNLMACYSDVNGEVDNLINSGEKWQFNAYCTFEGWVHRAGGTLRSRHSQTLMFSSDEINQITGNLTEEARSISAYNLVGDIVPDSNQKPALPAESTITVSQVAVIEVTTPTQPMNETQLMYENTLKEAQSLINNSFDIPSLLGDDGSTDYHKGKGNILIKALMVLIAVVGFGICTYVLIKIEMKKRAPTPPKKPAYTQQPPKTGQPKPQQPQEAAKPSYTPTQVSTPFVQVLETPKPAEPAKTQKKTGKPARKRSTKAKKKPARKRSTKAKKPKKAEEQKMAEEPPPE